MIRGITIQLLERAQTGVDGYGSPVYTETAVDVANVLVAPIETTSVPTSPELAYAKAAYLLAIPKRDTHVWENCRVVLPEPFAGTYYVVGKPTAGVEANIPGPWNKKVLVAQWSFYGEDIVTVYNVRENPRTFEREIFITVIEGVSLQTSTAARAAEGMMRPLTSSAYPLSGIALHIPLSARATDGITGEPRTYAPARAYALADDKSSLWTLDVNCDFIVQGRVIDETATLESLSVGHDGVYRVTSVTLDNTRAHEMQALEVRGA